jgi:hypothetical protein
MILEVHTVKTACVCSGCRKRGRLITGDIDAAVKAATDAGWTKKLETTKKKRATRRVSFTENYYCPKCTAKAEKLSQPLPNTPIPTSGGLRRRKPPTGPAGHFEKYFIGKQDVRWDVQTLKGARIYKFDNEGQLKAFLETVGGARYPYGGIKAVLAEDKT